jgi:D-alanine transaminase
MRKVYVNGNFIDEDKASVSIFDRGFLFADAIYEVTLVLDGKLIDFPGHMARLKRSSREMRFPFEPDVDQLLLVHRELIKRNSLVHGHVYTQLSRGNALDRDFAFPPSETPPTIVIFTQQRQASLSETAAAGKSVVTVEDLRWQRSDIKTVQLLYSSLAKMEALARGADDAWFVRDGLVTEGTSNNAFIVGADGKLVTRPLSTEILHGITRKAVLECAQTMAVELEERAFSVDEAKTAREAFSTSATTVVAPIVTVDGVVIGTGKPGPVGIKLREIYLGRAKQAAIG